MNQVNDADKFLFDIQGYLILPAAIEIDLIEALDHAVMENEALDHDETWAQGLPIVTAQHFIKDLNIENQVRLNGLPRLDPVFDQLIAHPSVLPYLQEFMGEPQLVNTWSISKYEGRGATGWHNGLPTEEYTVHNSVIRSPMLNVATMLTPNHLGDGCFTGEPGDVMIFTEALTHAGAAKTTKRRRTTLQYNHVHRNRACPMWDSHNARHYWMPPSVRSRFNIDQKALTHWMDYTIPDRSISGSDRIND